MISIGISDKDYVVVGSQPAAINGEVVALMMKQPAKTFYQTLTCVELRPENPGRQLWPVV